MTPDQINRKLVAVLCADVKGYSRLMGEDEEGTIHILKGHMEVIAGLVGQYRGRIVATGGDSVLAEYASVVDAVRCAVEIQGTLKGRNRDLPEGRRMEFRIGVNLGDVVEEGDNILGDGVNIAARLEGLAEPGGVLISGTAFDQVRNKLNLGYEYRGEQAVKNITEPVRTYKVLMDPGMAGQVIGEKKAKDNKWRGTAVSLVAAVIVVVAALTIWRLYQQPASPVNVAMEKLTFSLPNKPSIAVLPLVNMTGDPRQESNADGLTEDITATLSKIPELFVISRNSAFEYKGKPIDVKKVAEKLGIRYVLEGSIQKSGDRIRITAQLIDATSGNHIWSEKYDREKNDFFAISDEITLKIAIALQIKLTEGEQARVFLRDTKNLEAWALVSQSWNAIQRFTRGDVARARELAEQAVKLDPQYGMAWSLLAFSYFDDAVMGWCDSPQGYFKKAIELNQKALSLNKDLFCATAMLGSIYLWQRQYDRAIEMGRRSIELGPNIAVNYAIFAMTLNYAGNFGEAIKLGEQAIHLHPFCPPWYLGVLATSYRMVGRYEEALALYKRILTLAPKEAFYLLFAKIGLAEVYLETGRVEEAQAQASEILRINPGFSLDNWNKTEPFKDPANLERRLVALRKAGLK